MPMQPKKHKKIPLNFAGKPSQHLATLLFSAKRQGCFSADDAIFHTDFVLCLRI